MAVIWGLDLHDMQWAKFKNSYMWNNVYHLRRTKFIVYQIAMIFCVVSESLGTAALSDYVDQQDYVEAHAPGASVHNNDFVGAASYNIFVGIFVATIFGAGFFFDLFWPERYESPAVKLAWRICAILAAIMALSSALTMTIIVASHSSYVTGINEAEVERQLAAYGGSPLVYRHNGRAIASVVFIWIGSMATIASAFLLWKSYAHNDKNGPFSSHVRDEQKGVERDSEELGTMGAANRTAAPAAAPTDAPERGGSPTPKATVAEDDRNRPDSAWQGTGEGDPVPPPVPAHTVPAPADGYKTQDVHGGSWEFPAGEQRV